MWTYPWAVILSNTGFRQEDRNMYRSFKTSVLPFLLNTWWKFIRVHWCSSNSDILMVTQYFTEPLLCNLFSHSSAEGQCLSYWSLVLEKESCWEFSDLPVKIHCPLPSHHLGAHQSLPVLGVLQLSLNPHGFQYFILMGSKAFENRIQAFWSVSRGDDFLTEWHQPH